MSTMTAHYFNLKGKMNNEKKKLLKTTISIPLLTSAPLHYNNKIYFDGGVTDNIPYSPIKKKKSDIVFIVHFTPGYQIPVDDTKKIIEVNFGNSKHFIKGNFNYQQNQVRYMIEEGERFTLQIIDEYISDFQSSSTNRTVKDFYYYLSGARLLSILNHILKIGKDKRMLFIRYLKKILIADKSISKK